MEMLDKLHHFMVLMDWFVLYPSTNVSTSEIFRTLFF